MLPAEGFELAAHEVGHAVVAHIFGAKVSEIRVNPQTRNGGMDLEDAFPAEKWREDLLISIAGEVAQRKITDRPEALVDGRGHCSWAHDSTRAAALISAHLNAAHADASADSDEPFYQLLENAYRAVESLLHDYYVWGAVLVASDELINKAWKLSGEEFRAVVSPLLDDRRETLIRSLKLERLTLS